MKTARLGDTHERPSSLFPFPLIHQPDPLLLIQPQPTKPTMHHHHHLLLALLLPPLTLSSPTLPSRSTPLTLLLTTLSGGPVNHTLSLTPNTWTPTLTSLSISKISSPTRSQNLLSDCEFHFQATPKFVKEVDGSSVLSIDICDFSWVHHNPSPR
ncbi:uncharacterized protein MYCFIDRAFT_172843 [Pseudocercospora fijiensis CIRAD86]|uniref:Uncharacterized protein n=1 Tax=Pseudocercospora fijiensis (strain CIRAD86) TaxID=383855 RepID=M3B327_PSEFD|nr:uncharacterized protein MYCFIDRAFT_172843 [Pseudocercospora fijiensis CIRAD86]EME83767.1 hypothetical protein MYCFIDRAFT_172843 [Pseudocercospora fijiensis CIRAD86]